MTGLNGNAPCTGCELGMIAVRELEADRNRWYGEALAKQHVEEESKVKKLEAANKTLQEENERLLAKSKRIDGLYEELARLTFENFKLVTEKDSVKAAPEEAV